VAEDERGFVGDHRLWQGNPPDAPQLVGAVERVAKVTGRVAGTVVGDRGFGTAANDRALAEPGVTRIGLQRKGTVSAARAALERTRAFRRLQLAGRQRGPHQPPQAQLRAAAHQAAAAGRRPHLGGAGDLRLQPAADDRRGGRRVISSQATGDGPGALHLADNTLLPTSPSSGASSLG
jgi:IS5 family transposase